MATSLDVADLKEKADLFRSTLSTAQKAIGHQNFPWYPYDSLSNFAVLDAVATSPHRDIGNLCGGGPVLDVGCADGATSFFLALQGLQVDAVDYPPTNFNGMQGVKALGDYFKTSVNIHSVDLDSQFSLPRHSYGFALFLGLLYHLKNPFYALEQLSYSANFCYLSTRIAKFDPSKAHEIENVPVAYLVSPTETNNDPTNYWIFSMAGLMRFLERTGWEVCSWKRVGNTVDSDPASNAGDERAFCLLKSRRH